MSNGVGSYLRHIQNPAMEDPINDGARRALDGLGPAQPDKFENWSPEMIREAYNGAVRTDEKRTAINRNADEFVALHPEFLDTDDNGRLVNKMVKTMFGDCVHTVEQFEAAYQALLVTDSLAIDKAEVAKQRQKAADAQRKAAAKTRQEREKLRNLSENELETMSLEELRALTDRQLREDMQREAERGGLGL